MEPSLCIILLTGMVFIITIILVWEFLSLNDFSLFKKKIKVEDIPAAPAKASNKMFRVETTYTGVTLADVCELCPDALFRVKNGTDGHIRINAKKVKGRTLELYRTVYIKKLNAKNYELEVVDPSLL